MYFPGGRVAGGEVVLSYRNYLGGWSAAYGVLDATLSATGLNVGDPFCASGFEGKLVGPADGLVGIARNNSSAPSDAITMNYGPVKLCPAGSVPAQTVDPVGALVSPLEALTVRSTRPFARGSLDAVKASTSAGSVTLNVAAAHPGVVVTPKAGSFSLFAPTTIDLSGLRDVLGGPLGLSTVKTVVPTEVVLDRTFATAPSENARVGSAITVAAGVLRVGAGTGTAPQALALALGAEAGKTKLRLRHRVLCSTFPVGSWDVTLVAPDATSSLLRLACSAGGVEDVVPLPGSGPWVLVARRVSPAAMPCWYTGGLPDNSSYELDEVTFE